MSPVLTIATAMLLATAAAAAPVDIRVDLAPHDEFVAEMPGPAQPGSFTPAPVPRRDASAPNAPAKQRAAELAPTVFTNPTQFRGDGYETGSTSQSDREKKFRPVPGFTLRLPLESTPSQSAPPPQ